MNGKWLLMAIAVGMWTAPVHAQNVRGQDPASLVNAMKKAGYEAELGAAKDGDPMITSNSNGSKFRIFFMNCTAHKACATIQSFAGYQLETPLPQSRINDWNRAGKKQKLAPQQMSIMLEVLDGGGVAKW